MYFVANVISIRKSFIFCSFEGFSLNVNHNQCEIETPGSDRPHSASCVKNQILPSFSVRKTEYK